MLQSKLKNLILFSIIISCQSSFGFSYFKKKDITLRPIKTQYKVDHGLSFVNNKSLRLHCSGIKKGETLSKFLDVSYSLEEYTIDDYQTRFELEIEKEFKLKNPYRGFKYNKAHCEAIFTVTLLDPSASPEESNLEVVSTVNYYIKNKNRFNKYFSSEIDNITIKPVYLKLNESCPDYHDAKSILRGRKEGLRDLKNCRYQMQTVVARDGEILAEGNISNIIILDE